MLFAYVHLLSFEPLSKKHTMKKIGILVLSAAFALGACKKTEDTPAVSTYPTDGLKVSNQQVVFVMEETGAWCQFCPNGAASMVELVATHGDKVLPMAVHSGDPLTAPIGGILRTNFPAGGVPNFYVMNEDASQSPLNKISAYINEVPVLGVTHAVLTTDTSWNVYPKIEFFESVLNEDYLINSYVIFDAVLAKDYGNNIDLNQTSSVPVAGGSNPTKWLQDAAFVAGEPQIKAGDDYYHEESVVGTSNAVNPWGKAVADVNPFGREYIEGDILGTKSSSILISLPKVSKGPLQTDISIYTIVWRLRTDGSGDYDYVNGYKSHLGGN